VLFWFSFGYEFRHCYWFWSRLDFALVSDVAADLLLDFAWCFGVAFGLILLWVLWLCFDCCVVLGLARILLLCWFSRCNLITVFDLLPMWLILNLTLLFATVLMLLISLMVTWVKFSWFFFRILVFSSCRLELLFLLEFWNSSRSATFIFYGYLKHGIW